MKARNAQRFAPRPFTRHTLPKPRPAPRVVEPPRPTGLRAAALYAGLVLASAVLVVAACTWYALAWHWFVAGLGFKSISMGHAFALFALVLGREFPPLFVADFDKAGKLAGRLIARFALLFAAYCLVELGG